MEFFLLIFILVPSLLQKLSVAYLFLEVKIVEGKVIHIRLVFISRLTFYYC